MSNEELKERRKIYYRNYRTKHKDKMTEYRKKYYEENKDKELENKRRYYEKNKERFREYGRNHYANNKERYKLNLLKRCEREGVTPTQIVQKSKKKRVEKLRSEGCINAWCVVNRKHAPKYKEVSE